ncbi:hypothetical protein [Halanaerobium saccharolyticum]|nr:hypothetical protein [Halanaerobium saccharolyticum]
MRQKKIYQQILNLEADQVNYQKSLQRLTEYLQLLWREKRG